MGANKDKAKLNGPSEKTAKKKNQMPRTSEQEPNFRDRHLGFEGKQADNREKKQDGDTARQMGSAKPETSKLVSFFSRNKKPGPGRDHGVASDSFAPESWRVPTQAGSLEANTEVDRPKTVTSPATSHKAADPGKATQEPHASNGMQSGMNNVNGLPRSSKTAGINSRAGSSMSADRNDAVHGPHTSDKLSGWVEAFPAPSTGNNAAGSSRAPTTAGPTADDVGLGINLGNHMHSAGNISNKLPANTRSDQSPPTTSNNAQHASAPGPGNSLLSSAGHIAREPLPLTPYSQSTPANAGQSMNSHGASSVDPTFPTPIHGKPLGPKGVELSGASSQASQKPTTPFPRPSLGSL